MLTPNRQELLDRYIDGPRVLEAAVAGLSEADLDRKPADGGFSARECVHHTADSEMTSAIRLRRLVAEEQPAITGYDPDLFAARLYYATRPVHASLDAIRAARDSTASILEALSDRDWDRAGVHSEMGTYSIDTWLEIYAAHCHAHAEQARLAARGPDPE